MSIYEMQKLNLILYHYAYLNIPQKFYMVKKCHTKSVTLLTFLGGFDSKSFLFVVQFFLNFATGKWVGKHTFEGYI